MFGFSLSELSVVILIGILVLRPKDFPVVIRKIGEWYGKWRRIYYGFVNEINDIVQTSEENERKSPQHTEKRGGSHDRNN